jgi:hypothetical protein
MEKAASKRPSIGWLRICPRGRLGQVVAAHNLFVLDFRRLILAGTPPCHHSEWLRGRASQVVFL